MPRPAAKTHSHCARCSAQATRVLPHDDAHVRRAQRCQVRERVTHEDGGACPSASGATIGRQLALHAGFVVRAHHLAAEQPRGSAVAIKLQLVTADAAQCHRRRFRVRGQNLLDPARAPVCGAYVELHPRGLRR